MDVAPWAGRRLHFIGIGGAGMSGLALVARRLGARVSGSDHAQSSYGERLREHGIEPALGHGAANLPGGAEVVVSTAISDSNPELERAHGLGAPVLHRGDLLAELTRLKRCIAVSGTHGKTTTSAMVAHALIGSGRDPAYVVGGELHSTGMNAGWGAGEWIVVEADESDRSFLKLAPELAVITNVELDHHATYRSSLELEWAFAEFSAAATRTSIWEGVELALDSEHETFGIEAGDLAAHDLELVPLGSRFTVGETPVELHVPGRHNVLNALAALSACRATGLDVAQAAAALRGFAGAARRFEPRGTTRAGARVYDDYAHHPTEVRATLEAARTLGAERVVVCFQPHLYSRTARLAHEFGAALALADIVAVLDVYPARERAQDHPGVSGWLVAAAAADAAAGRRVYWVPTMTDAERLLTTELRRGDVLLTLGAGDVDRLAKALVTEAA